MLQNAAARLFDSHLLICSRTALPCHTCTDQLLCQCVRVDTETTPGLYPALSLYPGFPGGGVGVALAGAYLFEAPGLGLGLNHVMVVGGALQQLAALLQGTFLHLRRFADKRETAREASSEHWAVQARVSDGFQRAGFRHSSMGGRGAGNAGQILGVLGCGEVCTGLVDARSLS